MEQAIPAERRSDLHKLATMIAMMMTANGMCEYAGWMDRVNNLRRELAPINAREEALVNDMSSRLIHEYEMEAAR